MLIASCDRPCIPRSCHADPPNEAEGSGAGPGEELVHQPVLEPGQMAWTLEEG